MKASMFKLLGLKFEAIKEVLNGDFVATTETHSIGGGDWAIEVYDSKRHLLKEFVGSNGTMPNEEPADLWAEYDAWANEVHHTYKAYKAPDGSVGSLKWFYNEAIKGRLHGLTIK